MTIIPRTTSSLTFSSLPMVRSPLDRKLTQLRIHANLSTSWSNTRCSREMCRSLSSRSRQDLNLAWCLLEKKLIFKFVALEGFDLYLPTFQASCDQRNRHQIVFLYCWSWAPHHSAQDSCRRWVYHWHRSTGALELWGGGSGSPQGRRPWDTSSMRSAWPWWALRFFKYSHESHMPLERTD